MFIKKTTDKQRTLAISCADAARKSCGQAAPTRSVPEGLTTGGTLRSRLNGGNPRTALLSATQCPPDAHR